MTPALTASGGADESVALYEQLRLHEREGRTAVGGHRGLVVLLREGMAAWIAGRTACPATPEPVAASEQAVGVWQEVDELRGNLVRVLAGMAMAGRRGMSR